MPIEQLAMVFALGCAAAAIVYGGISAKWVVGLSPGSAKMQEIARAIQEGAKAYLNRQYTTIGLVGAVLFVAIWASLGTKTAAGFAIGAVLSALAGVHRHERLGSRQRADRRGRQARVVGGV